MAHSIRSTRLLAYAAVTIALTATVFTFALPPRTFILVRLVLLTACAGAIVIALRHIGSPTFALITTGVVAVRLTMLSVLAAWAIHAMVIAGREAGAEYAPLSQHNPDLVAIVVSRQAARDLFICALEIPLLVVMCVVLMKFGRVRHSERVPEA